MKCAEDTEDAAEEGAENFRKIGETFTTVSMNNAKEVNVMPKRDGTGPKGKGRMSGRGQGPCNPAGKTFSNNERGARNPGKGSGQDRGSGRNSGRGPGQGRGNRR
jgi:hypothetical protein